MRRIALVVALSCSLNQSLWAVGSGGYTDQVVGSKALGMGNTFVATADDPSAIFFNPAGLTQLDSTNLSIGLAPVASKTDYTATNGQTAHTDSVLPIVPNLYFTKPFSENKWVFGFGINSPFGLETHWSDTGPLRYAATDSKLAVANFNPSVGYLVNERVSVGFGLVYSASNATLRSKLNTSAINGVASPDGGKKLSGDGAGWGYDAGVLFKPSEKHSIGVTYRSEIRTEIKGTTELSGMSGTAAAIFGGDKYSVDTKTELRYPASLMFGYAFKPQKWTFEADGEWVGYSTVKSTHLNFSGESDPTRLSLLNTGNPIPRDWHDTWNLGLGANYAFNETWQARGGYFYYPQSIPTTTWDPSNPESSRNGFTLGGCFSRPSYTVDLAYNLILFNDRQINGSSSGSSVDGKYKTTANIISVNYTHRFGKRT